MDKKILKAALIASALTGMVFGAAYVVRRVKEMAAEDAIPEEFDPRQSSAYTVPVMRARPPAEKIPVTIDVVEDYEGDDEEE